MTAVEISNTVISGIIAHANAQLNADIQIKWKEERVGYISGEKENTIDGSNTTFYTKNFPIGDRDDNAVISGIDVHAYKLDNNSDRSDIIVTTIDDADIGKVTLASAPGSSDKLFFTYYSSPVDMVTPHPLVKTACIQLTAALCFTRIDVKKVQSYRVGKVGVMKQSQAYKIYTDQYYDTINRIRQEIFKAVEGSNVI